MTSPYPIYDLHKPSAIKAPVVISVPHSGTFIPSEIRDRLDPDLVVDLDDTDWYVNRLYDFALDLGVVMICAKLNRWVIDLNRPPHDQALYKDGRMLTGLVPTTNFKGEGLYKTKDSIPTKEEVESRKVDFYWPYHNKLEELLQDLKSKFGYAVLWDAHSIRSLVPAIVKDRIPDLVLGTVGGTSSATILEDAVVEALGFGPFNLTVNTPFKGGHITRRYGRPDQNIHAIQLEMAKSIYMTDDERTFDAARAQVVRDVLQNVFNVLIDKMKQL